jgi:hypothetical protein
MSDATKVAIAFVPAIVLFPFYVWFLARHKPKNRITKIIDYGKANGCCVQAKLIEHSCDREYVITLHRDDFVTHCKYQYFIDGHEYAYQCTYSYYDCNIENLLTLYYKPDKPKKAYPENCDSYNGTDGCIFKLLGFLPFLLPWVVLIILIHIF